ncbi:MAG: lyase HEAT-like repeat proteinHEAT repeat protein, partial [Pedosphaera sp.]|nr:lyase HEAT-like repeat proteinHEAT repeat protein [Pedosphaera sp.]
FWKDRWHDVGMRKWSRILFGILIFAVVGGIAWLVWRPNEPMYKGKRLSVWLKGYVYDPIQRPATDEAVRHIGTNAIPTLLRMLRAKDSPLKLRLVALAQKQHFFKVYFGEAWVLRTEGVFGFLALGADGKAAVPELIRMFEEDHSRDNQNLVAEALGSMGPAAAEAVPALVRSLGDTNPLTRCYAIGGLGRIHSRPEIVVSALVKCLGDQDARVRWLAADAIGAFGSDAKPAVPDLLKSLDDSNATVKTYAKDTLKLIDPEALAKAGVK